MAGSLNRIAVWRGCLVVLLGTGLTACEQPGPPADSAASNPESYRAATQSVAEAEDEGEELEPARTLSAPGTGMRGGRVRGATAGHIALQMILESAVTEDHDLLTDRLNTSLNMELFEQAITAYTRTELPETTEEQLAFYCNAYNVNALVILTMFTIDPDFDIGNTADDEDGVNRMKSSSSGSASTSHDVERARFDDQPVMVAQEAMTMGELRDQRILGLGDPRVLAYLIDINQVNIRPPREALWPRRIHDQLDAMCTAWVNEGSLATMENGKVQLGPLLARHAGAFEGETFGGVIGFLERYAQADGTLARALEHAAQDDAATE